MDQETPLWASQNDIHPTFGQNVRKLRVLQGLDRTALAEKSGICRRTIVNVELGVHNAALYTAWCLAQGLGVSMDTLMGGAVKPLDAGGLRDSDGDPDDLTK